MQSQGLPDAKRLRLNDDHLMREVSIALSLELDPAGEAISGSLEDAQGNRRTFQGWIEFALALEAVMDPCRGARAHSEKTCSTDAGVDWRAY